MRPPALIVTVALLTSTSGCATTPRSQTDLVSAAIELGGLAVAAGAYLLVTQRSRPAAGGSAALDQPLVGQVRWQGTSEGVPAVPVALRRDDGVVVPKTTTDQDGWFRFPFPPMAGWYRVSVDADVAEGETTLWLQDRRPGALAVLVRPRSTKPALDEERPAH